MERIPTGKEYMSKVSPGGACRQRFRIQPALVSQL